MSLLMDIVFECHRMGTIMMDAVTLNDRVLTGPVVRLGENSAVGNFHWAGGYVQSARRNLYRFSILLTGK